jgi:Xaa-Pro dipeptidase
MGAPCASTAVGTFMIGTEATLVEMPRFTFPVSLRREDVESKQLKLARLLADADCEALLLLERANVRWFTSGLSERGVYHAEECPALYVNPLQRWVICSNIDTQRLFDEELDGLGFQVKEWPSTGDRDQFLTDLCHGRRMAVDRPFRDYHFAGRFLDQERRRLSGYEQTKLGELAALLVHAVEATARNLQPGDTEEEVAGHLAHRLLKHGAEPAALSIAADDRARVYRRPGFTVAKVKTRCLLHATACKFGLFATTARTVCLGPPDELLKQEHDTAGRLAAIWMAAMKAGERVSILYQTGESALRDSPYEHEIRLSSPGWWTGRQPSEALFTPTASERLATGHAVVWQARIGGTSVCNTCIVQENGVAPMTAVEDWPVRRYVIQETRFDMPDLLIRTAS